MGFVVHFAPAGSNDHQKPIVNALTTLFFKDLHKKLESSGLAFYNVCVVKTQMLLTETNSASKSCFRMLKIKEFRLNYTQRDGRFGNGSSEKEWIVDWFNFVLYTDVCIALYVQCFSSVCEKTSQATRAGFEPTTSCLLEQTS